MSELYPGQGYFHAHNENVKRAEDNFRLKQITEEALHPTSPSPGHAEGCVCHRCRTYREKQ